MPELKVTWIIHSGFILEYSASVKVKIAIDPFLQPLSEGEREEWVNRMRDLDLLLITHYHFDHHGDACRILKASPKATYVGIFEVINKISKDCGVDNEGIGMNIGGTWIYVKDGFRLPITLVHSTHSSEVGSPVGFMIRFPGFTVYHPGDTGLFSDMELFGRLYDVKLAFLPIGSHFTMGIDEAVEAVKLIKPKYVIPMHYNTFPVIEANPEIFKSRVEEESDTKVIVLNPGGSHTFRL